MCGGERKKGEADVGLHIEKFLAAGDGVGRGRWGREGRGGEGKKGRQRWREGAQGENKEKRDSRLEALTATRWGSERGGDSGKRRVKERKTFTEEGGGGVGPVKRRRRRTKGGPVRNFFLHRPGFFSPPLE